MTNWQTYRDLFPHLGEQIYLNHAAIAPMNLRAQQAILDFMAQRLGKNIEFWPDALENKSYFIERVAQLIHGFADKIAITANTSAGLNILANGLDWKRGDRILLNDFEFPSNVIPFLNLQRHGVEIDFVKNRDGIIAIDDILENIYPRTRLLSISFVEFLNGFRNDLKRIGEICREHDLTFSVDAIQGLGALQLDVQDCQIDFLACGGHKWLMWPQGLAFAYISPRIFDRLHPAQAGWMSLEVPFDFFNYRQPFSPTARRFESGGFSTISIQAATATLDMMLDIGIVQIEQKILSNSQFLIKKIGEMGLKLYTVPTPKHLSGIVTFFHPHAEKLFEYLKQNHITVSLREGKIRLSPHFYHNEDDLQQFLDVLSRFKNGN